MQNLQFRNFNIARDDRNVVTVWIDVAGRAMNVFNESVLIELEALVSSLESDSDAKVIVFRSAKSSGFFAGADLKELGNLDSTQQIEAVVARGQDLFARLEKLRTPTVAVIHGPCLGGGLEFALACRYRIVVDTLSTRLALPETQLGLIPGWGGCQRLPARVGLMQALSMILQGRKIPAEKARRIGLADAVCPDASRDECIDQFVSEVLNNPRRPNHHPRASLWKRLADNTSAGRWIVFNRVNKQIARDVEHYPALGSAVKAIRDGYQVGVDGFATERREFARLVNTSTCRNLMGLFFRREKARDLATWNGDDAAADVPDIQKVAVIGAGAMGAGIGQLAALKGCEVVLKELSDDLAVAGLKRVSRLFDDMVSRGRLPSGERDACMSRITVTSQWTELTDADLVIEAVVERPEVKHAVFQELDSLLQPSALIVSNTSALSIGDMAKATQRPDRVAGLHFFNPVHRMELVEVVRADETSDATIQQLTAFVKRLGKTPVVTTDSPGFLVNRVLFPYIGEAVRMATEGISASTIDRELKRFGMPMGPIELLDHVGLDVGLHVAETLNSVLPDSDSMSTMLKAMVDRGWTGSKSGRGFYNYADGKRGEPVLLSEILPAGVPSPGDSVATSDSFIDDGLTAIQRRVIYPLINEAFRCLEENVVREPWMADLAMVLGTGFAPFRGGPVQLAETIGFDTVAENMKRLQAEFGQRYEPSKLLTEQTHNESSADSAASRPHELAGGTK
ncbi:MAG: 3-hydroxyacyl-CoA dehydrogenase NAD-binding domain-containing protein [Planctomycetaceae bacterium]